MTSRSKLSPEQLAEWAENPVTETLRNLLLAQIKELNEAKAEAYHPFQPERTQEILASLNGAQDTWEIVTDLLVGDWSYLEEEEDEPVWDQPERE